MRAPGKRCQGRYCFSSLKRFYDMDPETIVKSNRIMINPQGHCPPSETKYAWKCPRCRKKCACSTCRKAAGLEPLGKWIGGSKQKKAVAHPEAVEADIEADIEANAKANADADADASTSKANKGKTKAKAKADIASEQADTSKSSAKTASSKGKAKERTIVEVVAAAQKQAAKPKAKASTAKPNTDADPDEQDDGIRTPPPPQGKPAPKKTLASLLSTTTAVRAPVLKPIKPPTQAPPPVFEVIPTKLPEDNMRARMWIYESMVRFDKFGLNRTVLTQLDKFENWTHSMVQDMLACLLKIIAGLTNIEKGQPTKPFVQSITAYRTHGKSLQRGEPWSAATELLASLGLTRTPLPFVEHDIPVEVEAAAAQRSPSPPAPRVTRARRAKENNQYETARQLSLLDSWEDDEFGGTASEAYDDDDDDDDAVPSKRKRAPAKKSIYVYDDPSDDESMADPDDSARGRRARKPAQKAPAPEVRLTGRQQAIKLQQEEEAKQRKEEEDAANAEKEARKRRASTATSSKGTVSDASDDKEEGKKHQAHTNGRSHKKRRRLTAGNSDDEADSEAEDKVDARSKGATEDKDDSRVDQDQREMESPDLETKVSIIGALIDAAVMSDGVAEELKTAAENIVAMERGQRASHADMEKEIVEELAELNKRAPSIVSPEYQKWKAEKQQLEHDIAWRRQEARVIAELANDTHALRTGPIGHDVDGREYWHLREYQERMPKYTEGRYAWCLVVLGPAFPVDRNQPEEEEKEVKEDEADVSMAEAARNEIKKDETGNDSGLTWLDGTSDKGKTEVEDVKFGLPISLKAEAANGRCGEADSTRRICMGANNPLTIKRLIDYVTYRLEQVEYEEKVGMQEREKEARLAKESESGAASRASGRNGESEGGESMYAICKAKQMLKETQEERRKQTDQLVKRLNKSKEYFAWHREELAP